MTVDFAGSKIIIQFAGFLALSFVTVGEKSADLCRPGQSPTILKFFNCPGGFGGNAEVTPEGDELQEGYFEGDILGIDPTDDPQQLKKQLKNAVGSAYRWPDARIPYEISRDSFRDEREIEMIQDAMKTIEAVSCVKFVRKTAQDDDYIQIYSGAGCNSYVGRQGGQQQFSLRSGHACFVKGIILHELLHVIGFRHEQSRGDRDDFVDINWDNIAKRNRVQFTLIEDGETFGQPYDYASIMHYGRKYFAKDKKLPTITPRKPDVRIGQREELSKIDTQKLNLMYKCNKVDVQLDPHTKCKKGWTLVEDKCYFYSFHNKKSDMSWDEADKYCKKDQSGSLVTVSTQAIMDALITEISSSESAALWIGARRSRRFEDSITWSSGSSFKWEKSSKPWNSVDWHNCVSIGKAGQWRDELCSKEHPFVCEEATGTGDDPEEYR